MVGIGRVPFCEPHEISVVKLSEIVDVLRTPFWDSSLNGPFVSVKFERTKLCSAVE